MALVIFMHAVSPAQGDHTQLLQLQCSTRGTEPYTASFLTLSRLEFRYLINRLSFFFSLSSIISLFLLVPVPSRAHFGKASEVFVCSVI